MNRYVVALAFFFSLRVSRDPTVNASVKYLYSEISRKVFSISYIIMR
jgi:hypothetical protein